MVCGCPGLAIQEEDSQHSWAWYLGPSLVLDVGWEFNSLRRINLGSQLHRNRGRFKMDSANGCEASLLKCLGPSKEAEWVCHWLKKYSCERA